MARLQAGVAVALCKARRTKATAAHTVQEDYKPRRQGTAAADMRVQQRSSCCRVWLQAMHRQAFRAEGRSDLAVEADEAREEEGSQANVGSCVHKGHRPTLRQEGRDHAHEGKVIRAKDLRISPPVAGLRSRTACAIACDCICMACVCVWLECPCPSCSCHSSWDTWSFLLECR
jgi:hypothetical protein